MTLSTGISVLFRQHMMGAV
nr:unnamed protein product [Callosobruchus analis]